MQPQKSFVVEMERGERKAIMAMKTPSEVPFVILQLGER
jgi:hypothetical protein